MATRAGKELTEEQRLRRNEIALASYRRQAEKRAIEKAAKAERLAALHAAELRRLESVTCPVCRVPYHRHPRIEPDVVRNRRADLAALEADHELVTGNGQDEGAQDV